LSQIRPTFSKQTKYQTLLGLDLFWKNWILWYPKLDSPVFTTSASSLDFFHISFLIFLALFHASKLFGSLNLQVKLMVMFFSQKCQNQIVQNRKLDDPGFSNLLNLVINTHCKAILRKTYVTGSGSGSGTGQNPRSTVHYEMAISLVSSFPHGHGEPSVLQRPKRSGSAQWMWRQALGRPRRMKGLSVVII
jgi:hypothetical protein